LHSVGIVHRDLKPENLLYATNIESSPHYNTIKVADFGLAKIIAGNKPSPPPHDPLFDLAAMSTGPSTPLHIDLITNTIYPATASFIHEDLLKRSANRRTYPTMHYDQFLGLHYDLFSPDPQYLASCSMIMRAGKEDHSMTTTCGTPGCPHRPQPTAFLLPGRGRVAGVAGA
jgi:serine/threonine protein kinase